MVNVESARRGHWRWWGLQIGWNIIRTSCLAVNSSEKEAFSSWHIEIMEELAGVLSEGFRRMADLRTLEARHRELEEARDQAEAANRAKSLFLANRASGRRAPGWG